MFELRLFGYNQGRRRAPTKIVFNLIFIVAHHCAKVEIKMLHIIRETGLLDGPRKNVKRSSFLEHNDWIFHEFFKETCECYFIKNESRAGRRCIVFALKQTK